MKLVRWMRFSWDLTQLTPVHPAIDSHFQIRRALPDEEDAVRTVVLRAFTLDSEWNCVFNDVKANLMSSISKAFNPKLDKHDKSEPICLVVTHGSRVIAANAISTNPDSYNHLSTGPCILLEYHNRGIATALLAQSLIALRDANLTKAFGLAIHNSLTAQFLYTKFGSSSEPYEYEPHLAAS
jgi:hypothetical protein